MNSKLFFQTLLLLFLLIACSKNGGNSGDKIAYEVKANTGTFWVQYLDETGSQTQTNSTSNTWRIEFINKAGKPRQLLLSAVSGVSTLTLSIYVNNNVVKTSSGNNGDAVEYNLQ